MEKTDSSKNVQVECLTSALCTIKNSIPDRKWNQIYSILSDDEEREIRRMRCHASVVVPPADYNVSNLSNVFYVWYIFMVSNNTYFRIIYNIGATTATTIRANLSKMHL